MNFARLLRERRGLVFAVPAGALAVLVIIAALNLDRGSSAVKRDSRVKDAQSLLAPRVATPEELAHASGSITEQTAISLADGAWVQVADQTGRLAQQYSATKLEPLPKNQLAMTEPRARMYMRDGRVLTMSAHKGLATVPRRALESGLLDGEVEIQLFKPIDVPGGGGRAVDVLKDQPAMVLTAAQAQFDGVNGEVRCPKTVRVDTDAGSFSGEGLTLVLDGEGDGVERLVIERALEPIRIDRAARALAAKRRGEKNAAAPAVDAVAPTAPATPEPAPAAKPVAIAAAKSSEKSPEKSSGKTPAKSSDKSSDKQPETRFYRVILMGGVEVVQVRDGVVSTIRGEELIAVFSLESRGLDTLAFVPAGSGGTTMTLRHLAAPPALAIGALAFAAQQAPSAVRSDAEDSVTVTFGGRLEMLPVLDPAERLANKDDVRFDVVGKRVEMLDGRSMSRVICSHLSYDMLEERVEAEGRDGVPLTVSNPRLSLEGARFWASFAKGVGRLEGAGRMAFARGAARDVAWLEMLPALTPDTARMLVSADPAAVALVSAPPKRVPDPTNTRFDAAEQELEISWKGGVDLKFAGKTPGGSAGDEAKITGARFEGGVNVQGKQFALDSSTLDVAFAPGNAERIDAIVAEGGTKVRQLGADGSMNADRIELYLAANKKGDSVPSKLVARKGVEAHDARQTIWTEDLLVTFAEKKATQAKDNADAAGGKKTNAAAPELGDIDVNAVEARGGVQVLLAEGARVFADELIGNAMERKLRLTGENVAIVRSNIIADNLRDLRFDDAAHTAHSEGPGRFRAFRKSIALGSGRIERPSPDAEASLDASWSERLDYQEVSADKGTLDIRGDVRLRSKPNDLTTDAVDAKSVVLDIGVDPKDAGAMAKAGSGASATNPSVDAARSLDHFIARGGARIENRTWTDAKHEGEPRVFRVSGEHIEYDMKTREGIVVGDGGLLVNLPPDAKKLAAAAKPAAQPRGASIDLGAEGATRFTWKQEMALKHVVDDRYSVRMNDGVEMLHAGAREQDKMSMRCDTVEAQMRRPDETKVGSKAGSKGGSTAAAAGVDLGGSAQLLGVKGSGNVFIRTDAQDLECGEFNYSVDTGVATLSAAKGRSVTVAFRDQATPLQAQEILWDLRNGRIEITKPTVNGRR